ncbi:AAA family ATPase [Rhizobium sp. 007]|uniref:AAA family ATPase n=1 Tax=Rhizobium sp. 007 TaxID=2785056 RepID=UPI00188EAC62|nr:AAA family ATPase [Rhizobium sp. 007]QPB20198.1 AAA family ATPase [Rhizobium sp. 007]
MTSSDASNAGQRATSGRERFTFEWFNDFEDESLIKEWLIDDAFGKGEFTTIYGKPGAGKSVIVTDMACHVAAGMPWHGKGVKQGFVVYVAAERKDLTKRRMRAFQIHHDLKGFVPLAVVGGRKINLLDSKVAEQLATEINEAASEKGLTPAWIIIDTLSRTFGGGNQNDSQDMAKFIQSCDQITHAVTGSPHVTVIHHTGQADGSRGKGAIDLDASVDASFLVKQLGNNCFEVECDGSNDLAEMKVRFALESVVITTDKQGKDVPAPVVVPMEGDDATGDKQELTKSEDSALNILHRQIEQRDGECSEQKWRQACYTEWKAGEVPPPTFEAQKKRFDRAKKGLDGKGQLTLRDGMYVLAKNA